MKYEAVVFELDDTLFDRTAAQVRIMGLIVDRLPGVFQHCSKETVAEAFIESDRLCVTDFGPGAPSEGLRDKHSRVFLRLLNIKED